MLAQFIPKVWGKKTSELSTHPVHEQVRQTRPGQPGLRKPQIIPTCWSVGDANKLGGTSVPKGA